MKRGEIFEKAMSAWEDARAAEKMGAWADAFEQWKKSRNWLVRARYHVYAEQARIYMEQCREKAQKGD